MKNSYWIRSGLYTVSEKAASMLFGFGGAVLLYRAIPDKGVFGTWVLFLSIISIIEVARIGLLQNALVKFLSAEHNEDAGRITTASFALNGLLTLLIVIFCLGFSPVSVRIFNAEELAVLFNVYCFTSVALIPFYQCNYIQQANLDFKGIFWSNLVKGGVLFGFILYSFVGKKQIYLVDLALTQVAAALSSSLVSWFFARKYAKFSKNLDWGWVKKLFDYGKFVFGTNISTQLYKTVDKLLLGMLPGGGKIAVGVYDAAIRITNLTDVPTASMASILFPQSSRKIKEGNVAVKDLYEKAVGAILAIMIPVIILVLFSAEWLIYLTAGKAYSEAANLLRITILFSFFLPYAVQFGTVLDSIGKTRVNFIYTLFSLLLTTVLNLLFIPQFGAKGAAIGTLIAYAITFVFMQLYLHKTMNINPLKPFIYMFDFYCRLMRFTQQKIKGSNQKFESLEILDQKVEKI